MSGKIVGRDRELEAASAFMAAMKRGPAGLVFAGEPGIGKTTLWLEVCERARERSMMVFAARPVAAEARLAFAALADLLEPVADDVLRGLPEPQRRALAVALLREDPGGARLDQRAVGAATISVLAALARTAPVLVAIDDLHWLDRSSARVLAFAARRLGRLPVGLLACERIGADRKPGLEIEQALADGQVARVVLGPLGTAALHEVVKIRLGRPLTRRALGRIGQAAGGNPFFAVEIARSLPDDHDAGQAVLPLPDSLRALIGARVAALPERARHALLPAAALRSPTVELVTAGMDGSRDGSREGSRRALEQAAAAGIIEVDEARVRFTHPLFAAVVYTSAEHRDRRQAHRRLAAVLDDAEERAWHLALAADGADADLANTLDAAAEHARARGAPDAAFELTEQALRLTPPGRAADVQRRRVQAAEYHYHAGEPRRARELLDTVLSQVSSGWVRANALRLLGEILYHEQSFPEAVRLFEQALEHGSGDASLVAMVELHLTYAINAAGNFTGSEPHARRALTLSEQAGDESRLAEAIAVSVMTGHLLGRGLDEAALDRALALEDQQRQTSMEMRPSLIAGLLMLYEDRAERACQLLADLRQRTLDRGEESDLAYVASCLAWAEGWRGRLDVAVAYADEAVEYASRTGMESVRCTALALGSVPVAYAGEAEAARSMAEEALRLAAATGYGIGAIWARWALAVLSLSLREPAAALVALAPLLAEVEREGVAEPVRVMFLADGIEALAALGQLDRAERLTAMFEQAGTRLQRAWALAQADRCRALLLAARGDLAAAAAAAASAVRRAERLEPRLELARTLLVAGEIERRGRKKRSACELLARAAEIFESAGASLWAQRTRAELDRAAGRRTGGDLTESEKLVADLAASGLTNRQVAAQLFMSPKTVEANLARVYSKLGIRSRAELGAAWRGQNLRPGSPGNSREAEPAAHT
ncbi:MAG TPA: AAA family ATPase [Streptosporangiaceae bacterium]|nr:AAA family ATPase [Streptosporangiaceae bacterium]